MKMRAPIAVLLGLAAFTASAQLYRWTDEKGRTHVTDTPPPASAKNVQKKGAAAKSGEASKTEQVPYEISVAAQNFPVTLYTSPKCLEQCTQARAALNKRGVPFKEIQVWDRSHQEEMKKFSSGNVLPVLLVGRSVHEGFDQDAYDALLDSARYPKAGAVAPRAQAAPPPPEEYSRRVTPAAEPAAAEEPKPSGPYAPKAPPQKK